ncbi:hypothetical protein ACFU5P_19990, partial [Streptomyces sp. NPDC057433]|uniref:hypothetical protein n=1 Tax=Streptomyces sp. NPDC057433 TaxID=3346132 RepID=UPI0036A6C8B3
TAPTGAIHVATAAADGLGPTPPTESTGRQGMHRGAAAVVRARSGVRGPAGAAASAARRGNR